MVDRIESNINVALYQKFIALNKIKTNRYLLHFFNYINYLSLD